MIVNAEMVSAFDLPTAVTVLSINLSLMIISFPSAFYNVSMERIQITVSEDVGMVEVCALLTSNSLLTFPLPSPVFVTLTTVPGTSGICINTTSLYI